MHKIDVIGIGAINIDYIYYPKTLPDRESKITEGGGEDLEFQRDDLLRSIRSYHYQQIPRAVQVGGSAYLAIKTIDAIDDKLKTSFIGVCGTPTKDDLELGFNISMEDEVSFLHNREFLFFSDRPCGLSEVLIKHGTRYANNINAGSNDELHRRLVEHPSNSSLTSYLASARWIHISSLCDFDQFVYVFELMKKPRRLILF